MNTAPAPEPDAALAEARWDLEPLVAGEGPGGVKRLLSEAKERADAFAERYRGKVAGLDAAGMAAAMRELEAMFDGIGRAGSYAALWFTTDTRDPERGALMQDAQERGASIETALLFFDLEWNLLPDDRAEALLASGELDFCRHHLRTLRRYLPHQLTEPEEKIVTEMDVTGASAFQRLFTEQITSVEVEVPGADEPAPLIEALSLLQAPDRSLREQAAAAITTALEPGIRTRAFIFNTLLADKATGDRLRSYEHWLAARNLSNEASDESVQALIDAVAGRYELARRWYRLKAKLLGLERLAHYDRMAPLSEADNKIPYDEARELVLSCYGEFSPALGKVAAGFFEGRIDAPPEPGKRGGAFCAYATPTAHPYVMLNYTSRPGDVLVMAHELGHGVHGVLAAGQGIFQYRTPLTVSETASIFGETITLNRLLERAPGAKARLGLLAESLDGAVAAVFRQVAMNRFEHRVHSERRSSGELSVEAFDAAWIATQNDLLGDSVDTSGGYEKWWSYVPHFIDTPGYVYAYAYGHLLALSVYSRYEQEGESFVPAYLEMLSAGGSMPPEALGAIVGVDLTDPGFWTAGLGLVERQLGAAEAAAGEAGLG